MANKPSPIIINNFQKGMSASSAFGFQEMVGIDITTRPGYARVNPKLKKDSGTIINDTPNFIKRGDTTSVTQNNIYVLDDSGGLYKRDVSGTWSTITGTSGSNGTGLAIYKGYLHDIEGSELYVYDLAGASWVTSPYGDVYSLPGGAYGVQSLHGQDDILYLAANEMVGSIQENDGQTLDPTVPATYTVKINAATPALDLPEEYDTSGLSALGNDLMIASNNSDINESVIFPWDREGTSFDLPIRMGLNDVHASITTGNITYFIAGVEGTIYKTNGVSVVRVAILPDEIIKKGLNKSVTIKPGAITIFKNLIYFATTHTVASPIPAYIWSVNPTTGALNIEHTLSTNEIGSGANNVTISSLFPISDTKLLVGYNDAENGVVGLDIIDTSRRYTDYSAYIITHLQPTGSGYRPRTFQFLQVTLTRGLASGEGVKVQLREDLSTDWSSATTIATLETVGKATFEVPYGGTHRLVQLKISLTTPSDSDSTPELMSVVLQ